MKWKNLLSTKLTTCYNYCIKKLQLSIYLFGLFFSSGLALASGEINGTGNQTNPIGNTINVTEDGGIGLSGTQTIINNGEIKVWGNSAIGMNVNPDFSEKNYAYGSNTGTITLYGDGSIGMYTKVNFYKGLRNENKIISYANNSYGVYSPITGVYNAVDGLIEMHGNNSYGIYSPDAINAGQINMYGNNSYAIMSVMPLVGNDANNKTLEYGVFNPDVQANNRGSIMMYGDNSTGIFFDYDLAKYDVNYTVLNTGTIGIFGNNSYGIRANNITTNMGTIIVGGDYSYGIYAGDTIKNSGEIIVNGDNSYGIYVPFKTYISGGKVTVNGDNSYGIYLAKDYLDSEVELEVNGDHSYGVYSLNGEIDFWATVIVNGDYSYGLYGYNNYAAANPSAYVLVEGDHSYGLYSEHASAAVGERALVSVAGDYSYGLYSNGKSGEVILNLDPLKETFVAGLKVETNSSGVRIDGKNSYGMYSAVGADISNRGGIYVNGDNSYGMYSAGSGSIHNHGRFENQKILLVESKSFGGVYVNGNNSYGIYSSGSGDIINGGVITPDEYGDNKFHQASIYVNGANSYGMYSSGSGNILNSGNISVDGIGSYGAYISGEGNILNDANATITINGDSAVGILVGGNSSANIVMQNEGNIIANGNNAIGIKMSSTDQVGENTGNISATGNAIGVFVGNDNSFFNTGNITAEGTAILMGSGDNQLYFDSGATGTGLLDGGSGNSDTLILGAFSADGGTLSHDFVNFDHLTVVSGDWIQTGNGILTNNDESANIANSRSSGLGSYVLASDASLTVLLNASSTEPGVIHNTEEGAMLVSSTGSNVGTIVADTIKIDGSLTYVVDPSRTAVSKDVNEIRVYNLFANSEIIGLENANILLPEPFGWNATTHINETTGGIAILRDLPDSATNGTDNGTNGGGGEGGGGNGIDLPGAEGMSLTDYPRNKIEQDLAKMFRDKVYDYAKMPLADGWKQMGEFFGTAGSYHSNVVSGEVIGANSDVPDVAYDYNTYGLFGVTQYNSDRFVFGLNYGLAWSDVDYKDFGKSTEKINHYYGGLYGKYSPSRKLDILAQVGYIYSDHELERGIRETTGDFANQRLVVDGDFASQEFYASLNLQYNIDINSAWRISPFAGLSYAHIYEESYDETPFDKNQLGHYGLGSGERNMWYAMHVDSASYNSLVSQVGIEGKYRGEKIELRGSLAWEHEFLDRSSDKNAYFLWQENDYYRYNGVIDELKMGRDSAILNLGLNFEIDENLKLTLDYKGEFNLQGDYNNHVGQVGLVYSF